MLVYVFCLVVGFWVGYAMAEMGTVNDYPWKFIYYSVVAATGVILVQVILVGLLVGVFKLQIPLLPLHPPAP